MVDVLPVAVERYTYEVAGWGVGEVAAQGNVLVAHDLPSGRGSRAGRAVARDVLPTTPKEGASPPEVTLADEPARVCAGSAPDFVPDFVQRVRRQLAGVKTSYRHIALDLSWCTPFQAELAAALLAVPWGEVVSYGELAALAGRPGAARAAGSFCAQNRFALVMPCHRVVGATGIGGYGDSGVGLKRRLLALEGVEL